MVLINQKLIKRSIFEISTEFTFILNKQKGIFLFFVRFFTTYFFLFGLYSLYLNKTQQKTPFFKCSPITQTVAEQTKFFLELLDYSARTEHHDQELSVKLLIDDKYVARVIEGCNSLSIIILFIAFIIAFPGNFKDTSLYIIVGSFIIYIVNIIRIAFLSWALNKFDDQKDILHNLVFPSIIYVLVFLLWVIWVNVFSNYKKK